MVVFGCSFKKALDNTKLMCYNSITKTKCRPIWEKSYIGLFIKGGVIL